MTKKNLQTKIKVCKVEHVSSVEKPTHLASQTAAAEVTQNKICPISTSDETEATAVPIEITVEITPMETEKEESTLARFEGKSNFGSVIHRALTS